MHFSRRCMKLYKLNVLKCISINSPIACNHAFQVINFGALEAFLLVHLGLWDAYIRLLFHRSNDGKA